MPQALPLPDGRFVTIREGETPAQTWERAQRMYPEAFRSKEPEKKEVTVGGQTKEFFKGLAPRRYQSSRKRGDWCVLTAQRRY